jgi:hypothetical protein
MFKQGSAENEIFRSMEKTLVKSQVENRHGLNKLAKVVDLLNNAATIFDQAGMSGEALEITEILQSLANDLDENAAKSISFHNLANETKHHLVKMNPGRGWENVEPKKLITELDGSLSAMENAEMMKMRHLSPSHFGVK